MAAYDVFFMDPGGEYYVSLGITAPGVWFSNFGASLYNNNAPAGRSTLYALNVNSTGWVQKNFTTNYAGWCCGQAQYVGTTIGGATALFWFLDNGTQQVEVRVDASGRLYFTKNGTQIGSSFSTNALTSNQGWTYFECKVVIAGGTSGSMEVRVNGVTWLTLTGINTQNSANAYAQQVRIGGITGNAPVKDIYIMADTGSGPRSTYLGDITVPVIYPNAAGTNQAWTNNGGASQTASVQDGISGSGTRPDGDTSYISSSTAGQISDFAHQTLSLTGTIYGVMHVSYMRKDDAGSRAVRQVCLSGVTTEDNGSDISLGNSYQYYFDVIQHDPNTSADWTATNFNNATFGVKEIS